MRSPFPPLFGSLADAGEAFSRATCVADVDSVYCGDRSGRSESTVAWWEFPMQGSRIDDEVLDEGVEEECVLGGRGLELAARQLIQV